MLHIVLFLLIINVFSPLLFPLAYASGNRYLLGCQRSGCKLCFIASESLLDSERGTLMSNLFIVELLLFLNFFTGRERRRTMQDPGHPP